VNGRHPNTRVVDARAKVNVYLRVLGRRDDGYHDLDSFVLPIELADRLEIHASAEPEFRTLSLSLDLSGDRESLARVPMDESNLVLRAAAAIAERAAVRGFAEILLEKRIPAAAGLGGGSSDAAATLHALNDLWGIGLDPEALRALGAGIGSDVPALLAGAPVVMRGRGETVRPVAAPALRWVLATFAFPVRTADAFAWWDSDRDPAVRSSTPSGGDRDPLEPGDRGGGGGGVPRVGDGDVARVAAMLRNDLEPPVIRRYPVIRRVKDRLLEGGVAGAVMSGSGPTVAGLLPPDVPGLPAETLAEVRRLTGRRAIQVASPAAGGPSREAPAGGAPETA
jgi:4-diphosphocytidyl-2-C-methyl-D-erythritol kinase